MEKVKIIQIGMFHEHAIGKIEVLKQRTDLFDLVGYVDERDFCSSSRLPNPNKPQFYEDIRKMTLEEALDHPGLEAVTVEVPNYDLVPVALKCMEKNLAMHMGHNCFFVFDFCHQHITSSPLPAPCPP